MPVTRIEIENIRLHRHSVLNPAATLNLISGANASGKTTLLEAVHLLAAGKSFRTAVLDNLITHNQDYLRVSADISPAQAQPQLRLGFSKGQLGRKIIVNGVEQIKLSLLAQHLPLQVISPDSHFEFLNHARHRRAALDWILFHVEPDFQGLWNRYQRILQQRNQALKDPKQTRARFAWDEELVMVGDTLQGMRGDMLDRIKPMFQAVCAALLQRDIQVELRLIFGWDNQYGLAESLLRDRGKDQTRGFTHSGPHRNDLQILIGEHPSRDEASHGQNKLLVIALRLAQIQILLESRGRECCLLIDDLAAELDITHRQHLAKFLAEMRVQVFMTATDPELVDVKSWPDAKTFHVERGVLSGQVCA
jgi:DNA replication and repair protein RecF